MNIQDLVTRVKKIGLGSVSSHTRHPQRDWLSLISTTLVLFLAIALWSFISFQLQVSNDGTVSNSQNAPELKAISIDTVQAIFDRRATARTEYLSTKHFVDPSR